MCMIIGPNVSIVQAFVIKVLKDGKPTRYRQKYSKAWECDPQFSGDTRHFIDLRGFISN